MQKRSVIRAAVVLSASALVAVPAAFAASSAPASVTVRIEGKTKTLLAATPVKTTSGSITTGGAPAGKCPATSAQGALQDATHGGWKGSWSKQYSEYYITSILGDTEASAKAYWAIYVNGVYATAGACDIPLKSGDAVLFAVIPGKGKTPEALSTSIPAKGIDGDQITPIVVYYDAKGHKHAVPGATVTLGHVTDKTNGAGITKAITLTGSGRQTLKVSKPGYVRTEATISVS
jgi:hypothetical protein